VATDFVDLAAGEHFPPRSACDKLLLSAHLRLNAETESTEDTVVQPSEETG
jgi:hypothetical protein